MARSRATFVERHRLLTRAKIVADGRREFATLVDRHAAIRALETPARVLAALRNVEAQHPEAGPVLRALVTEVQCPTRAEIACDILLWAFVPMVKHRLERANSGANNRDMFQLGWLSLFETFATLPISVMRDVDIVPAVKADLHRGLMNGLKAERKEEIAARKFYERVSPLGPQGIGARRQYRRAKLKFSPDERPKAKAKVVLLGGPRVTSDPRLDFWMATVIDGEPVASYVRRLGSANSDDLVKLVGSRLSKQKGRFSHTLGDAINCDRLVANDDVVAELEREIEMQMLPVLGSCVRKEMPEYE